ncbi:hypothetical protein CR970_02940 [Candidatus Saccharibacteria bacterium]|nr:MAG: hypothetical protein CR970_02940 [Candidatus Saccharibacteria bacterium]
MPKLGIQGTPGSYHEQAALGYQPTAENEIMYLPTFRDVFAALADGRCDQALVAVANNAIGFIHEPYSYITKDAGKTVRIVGETYVRAEHHLWGVQGAVLKDITHIHSQSPALQQCSRFLHDSVQDVEIVEEADTALSAQKVAQWQDASRAAIASQRAGELHGLHKLAAAVQDEPDNITRFVLLQRAQDATKIEHGDHDKTTCLLQTTMRPGALASALVPFREAQVSISSLQSQFIPNSPFQMQFFIEFEAGLHDSRTTRVIDWLEGLGCTLSVLGTYAAEPVPMRS